MRAKKPLNPVVKNTPGRKSLITSAVIAWSGTVITAWLFVLLGKSADYLAAGGPIPNMLLFMMAATAIAAAATVAVSVFYNAAAEEKAKQNLRSQLLIKIFRLGPAKIYHRSGELVSLFTDSVDQTSHYRASFLGPIIAAMSSPLLAIAVVALAVDAKIAGWLVLLILVVPLIVGGFQSMVGSVGKTYRKTQAKLTTDFLEAIQTLDALTYLNAAGRTEKRLADSGEKFRVGLMKMLAGNQILILIVDAVFSLAIIVAATLISAKEVASGQISIGAALSVLLTTTLIIGPVNVIGSFFYIGIGGRGSQTQISNLLDEAEPLSKANQNLTANPESIGQIRDSLPKGQMTGINDQLDMSKPAIELVDVSAGWDGNRDILKNFNLTLGWNEVVAVVGPSGVGKSTLSALIQGYILPSQGAVKVAGMDWKLADPAQIRRHLAVVEQQTFMFMGTIAENLSIANPKASEQQLWQALTLAGLASDVANFPLGLETQVGEHGALLSGGQRQRLAIARAFLKDAPILILDEPTSQVDLASEKAILDSLVQLAKSKTVLVIAHRPNAVMAADRVIDLGAVNG